MVGVVMGAWGSYTYFVCLAACSALFVAFVKPSTVTDDHISVDAPTDDVPLPDSRPSSGGISPHDPRVAAEVDISHHLRPDDWDEDPNAHEADLGAASMAAGGAGYGTDTPHTATAETGAAPEQSYKPSSG